MRPAAILLVLLLAFARPAISAPAAFGGVDVAPKDFADPFVVRDGASYLAFATGAHGVHVQVSRSRDLVSWAPLPDALPTLPTWAARGGALTWAPAALRRERSWVLYFTTRDGSTGHQCISRAISTRAVGPYSDDSTGPFVCQTDLCGSIDPSPYVDPAGGAWLLWKSDENNPACRGRPRIWSQSLSEDGLAVTGTRAQLIATDQPWEGPLVEGPSMARHGDQTYLFYSANRYESADYAIGYATCAGPSGPCTKITSSGGPLVKSTRDLLGPGGQELFADAAGQLWMAFHGWTAPKASYAVGGARSLRLARITFLGGAPVIDL